MTVFLHPGCEMSSSKLTFFKEVTLQTFLMSSLLLNFNLILKIKLNLSKLRGNLDLLRMRPTELPVKGHSKIFHLQNGVNVII